VLIKNKEIKKTKETNKPFAGKTVSYYNKALSQKWFHYKCYTVAEKKLIPSEQISKFTSYFQ
jgi:hypothetical protein